MQSSGARVLVVEDEDDVRSILVEALTDAGFEVVEAADGETAIAWLESEAPIAVLLTDVRLPGKLDGLGVVDQARTRRPEIKVIVVSGYAPQLRERLQELVPPVKFFGKPYRLSDITEAIAEGDGPRPGD